MDREITDEEYELIQAEAEKIWEKTPVFTAYPADKASFLLGCEMALTEAMVGNITNINSL